MSTNGNLLVILFGALGIGGAYAFACLWLAARMMQQSAAAMKLSMLLYATCAGILWIFYSRTLDFTMLMHATTVFSVGMMISSFSAAALLSETPKEVHKAESGLRGYLYLVFAGVVLVLLGLGRIPYLNGSSPTHGRGAKFVKLLMIVHQQYPTLSTIAGGFALAIGGWQCSRVFFSWFVQMRKDRRARIEALQIGSKDIKHCPPSKVYSGSPFATIETKSPAETDETKEV